MAKPAKTDMAKPAIVIRMEDGMITAVEADCEVNVYVVEKDGNGLDETHPYYVKRWDANVWQENVAIKPHKVSAVQKEWEVG